MSHRLPHANGSNLSDGFVADDCAFRRFRSLVPIVPMGSFLKSLLFIKANKLYHGSARVLAP